MKRQGEREEDLSKQDIEEKTKRTKTDAPQRILRAMMYHEEGMFWQYFDFLLPPTLPTDLHPSLDFFKTIYFPKEFPITDKTGVCEGEKNTQYALHANTADEVYDIDFTKPTVIEELKKCCGQPVIDQVGTYITVCIPTFE